MYRGHSWTPTPGRTMMRPPSVWVAVMDIVVWLRSLGLGKYEAVFRENDIDETVLPSLTHENLKELGVASFGHRVKLLDAIAALRSDASDRGPYFSRPRLRSQTTMSMTATQSQDCRTSSSCKERVSRTASVDVQKTAALQRLKTRAHRSNQSAN